MQTSEVLNRAADLIEEHGWAQGSDVPGLCVIQAAYRADRAGGSDASRAVERHVGVTCAARWNDAPGRTAAEVVEVLRAAAVIEAAREEQDAAWETYAELVSA